MLSTYDGCSCQHEPLIRVKVDHVYRVLTSTPPFILLYMSFQLHREHTVLQPFRRFQLIVPCPRTQHRNIVPRLRERKHDISPKILDQAGFETAQQAATSAQRQPGLNR